MKVKIMDVAREANVSVATVSRVVNNIPLVNEETRERVLEAIKSTGYKPNAIARSLKMQRTNTLGIMVPDVSDPLYTEIVRGAEDVSGIYHYNIILANTDDDVEKEKKSLNVLVEKQCDGIIYAGKDLSDEMREELIEVSAQVVLANVSDERGKLSGVLIDNEAAAHDLAQKCIGMGHKQALIFADARKEGYINQQRLSGVKRAYMEAGLAFNDGLIFYDAATPEGGYRMMKEALGKGTAFSNVFCFNDEQALGAMRAAMDAGKRVPEDISVCGFNDCWISEWVRPEITTVSQPMFDIGAVATRMLIKMCEHEASEPKTLFVPYELVMRHSVSERV